MLKKKNGLRDWGEVAVIDHISKQRSDCDHRTFAVIDKESTRMDVCKNDQFCLWRI